MAWFPVRCLIKFGGSGAVAPEEKQPVAQNKANPRALPWGWLCFVLLLLGCATPPETRYTWYPEGQKKSERVYRDGKRNGLQKTWHPNGVLKSEAYCKDDAYEGLLREWYDTGAPYKVMNYHRGREVGRQQVFWPDGRVGSNYVWQNNRIYGLKGDRRCETRGLHL